MTNTNQTQITPDFSHRIIEQPTTLENFIYSLSAMLDRSDSILNLLMLTAEIERNQIAYGALDAVRCEIEDVKQFARAYSKSEQ
jgi:hypothetical protein